MNLEFKKWKQGKNSLIFNWNQVKIKNLNV